MGWIIAYLVSTLIVPTIFAACYCDRGDNKVEIVNGDQALQILIVCVLWPIFLATFGVRQAREVRKEYFKKRGRDITRKYSIERINQHDRTGMVDIPESELKFLLKNYRKKRIELDSKTIELIRDELMNRNAERQLLR